MQVLPGARSFVYIMEIVLFSFQKYYSMNRFFMQRFFEKSDGTVKSNLVTGYA